MRLIQKAMMLVCLLPSTGSDKPTTLEEIYDKLGEYPMKYPDLTTLQEIGRSYEDRPIYCMKIHDSNTSHSAGAVVDFGTHGREWASPDSALYVIDELVTRFQLRSIIRSVQWFIIPVLNPDGYHYSTTKDRTWRKNRRPLPNSSCVGVDLNRNFPIGWDSELSEREKWCHNDYSGPWPLSEPETKVLGRFFEQIGKVDAYVSVHSCAQCVLYPYSSQKIDPPQEKLREILEVADKMKQALEKVAGREYVVQRSSDLDGETGGASDDFVFVNFSVPIVLTLELGFDSPSVEKCFFPKLPEMGVLNRECMAGIGALGYHLGRTDGPMNHSVSKERKVRISHGNQNLMPWSAGYLCLVVTLWVYRNSILSFSINILVTKA